MLLTESRRATRVAGGELVTLDEQDRGGWDRALIDEGHELVRECLRAARRSRPGPVPDPRRHQRRAHRRPDGRGHRLGADRRRSTPSCAAVAPSPIVALNRAVAIAELDGPEVALAKVDRLRALASYHAWHATRADLLRRLGRSAEAREAYDAALALIDNEAERAYLTRRRGSLAP